MTGWIPSRIWKKIFFENLGEGGFKFKTEHKIWGIVWLVGVYSESGWSLIMENMSDKKRIT